MKKPENCNNILIAPSVLACDFSKAGSEVERVTESGADLIHLDIMDGHFVPNISFGPDIVRSLKKYSNLPFDVHLMIENPKDYIDEFIESGADIITFHVEAKSNIDETINKIRNKQVKAGLVVKPNTKIEEVFPYLDRVYMILIMTVEPGFGGQSFMENMMEKVIKLKKEIKNRQLNVLIEVDGGINLDTINHAIKAGSDICVVGTGVFKEKDAKVAISKLKNNY